MRHDIVIGNTEYCSVCQQPVERCNCYPSFAGVDDNGHSCAATRHGGDCLCFDYVGDYEGWADDEDIDDGEAVELPDTCRDGVSGHWFVVTYGRAPYTIHAADCAKCLADAEATPEGGENGDEPF